MGEAKRRGEALAQDWARRRVNELANHPDIATHLAPLYRNIDLSGFFRNPDNVVLFEGTGAMLFAAVPDGPPGFYDTHYLFPRRGGAAGESVLDAVRKCISVMFDVHGARVLCGNTPRENRAARYINRALGSVPMGEGTDSQGRPYIFYVLERATWAILSGASSGASAP